jgi:anaerobic selenocysteine-containing dehydrogenase
MVEGMGVEELTNNAEILHCRWILPALVNNIDIEGGEELTGPHMKILGYGEVEPRVAPLPEAQARKQLGSDKFRLLSWQGQRIVTSNLLRGWGGKLPAREDISHGPSTMRAILTGKPYPVRACITTGSNPMITSPNIKLVYQALKSLDLYIVLDHWMTPSAVLADYVLPCASWMERPLLWDFSGYGRYMGAGEAALPQSIPGEYDHRDDFDLWRGLGVRLGQEGFWPWKTLEEYYDARLKPLGMTHKEFVYRVRCERKANPYKKYEKSGFATNTGKIELYNTTFEKLDYDPLPVYREHGETKVSRPDLAKEYPLTLITGGRIRQFYHSDFRQIDSVRRLRPEPLVQLHPETAAKLGISEGDWAWIESPRGKVRMKVVLFDGMRPDIVHAEHGWWLPELPQEEPWLHGVWESNINVLLADDPELCNPVTGAFPLKTNLCKVYKVKTY